MKIKVVEKLVRDNIPEVILRENRKPVFHYLNDDEFKTFLNKKFYEEVEEYINAEKEEKLKELADILELIRAATKLEGSSFEHVLFLADKKVEKMGGYEKHVYLEKTIDD